ncbi:MAG: transposase [Fimbriiglobus sp.]
MHPAVYPAADLLSLYRLRWGIESTFQTVTEIFALSRFIASTPEATSMDEQPVQLLKETRTPIPATRDHPKRVDYEYERAGTASLFLFCEPLVGWREASVRDRRTKVDWAWELAAMLGGRYAQAEKVILVCDNLNTHTSGASYEAFDAGRARSLVRRLDLRHTPKHGSRLNVAECELSAMTRQCVRGRRFGTVESLRAEAAAWHANEREPAGRGLANAGRGCPH